MRAARRLSRAGPARKTIRSIHAMRTFYIPSASPQLLRTGASLAPSLYPLDVLAARRVALSTHDRASRCEVGSSRCDAQPPHCAAHRANCCTAPAARVVRCAVSRRSPPSRESRCHGRRRCRSLTGRRVGFLRPVRAARLRDEERGPAVLFATWAGGATASPVVYAPMPALEEAFEGELPRKDQRRVEGLKLRERFVVTPKPSTD